VRRLAFLLLVAGVVTSGTSLAADDAPEPVVLDVALAHRTFRRFKLKLPDEQWRPVGDGIPVAHAGGANFATKAEGAALLVDTDGDGETDTRVAKRSEGQVAPLVVKLRGKREDGGEFVYAVRLQQGGSGWEYAPGGAVRGKVGETLIQVIDRNGNGRYDDVGEDAVVVGRGEHAAYLSESLLVNGELHALDVAADGTRLALRPFEGPTGLLDLTTEFVSEAKLRTALIRNADRTHTFDVAQMHGPTRVPVGEFSLGNGMLALGDGTLRLRGDSERVIAVEQDAQTVHAWGGPIRAEFSFNNVNGELQFDPHDVRYTGRGGEEYLDMLPLGASPEFVVKSRETAEEILRVAFPGST